ncbi:MAG: FG-GAP repeat protein, partial [Deltaproteobacteria bacterium]|nr:FG-GAP repeat protein [Deltaproteobacteria bacterium]
VSASRLGQVLAVGDVDGDGADDLLMSQRVWSTVPSANNQFGAVRLVLGGGWLRTPEAAYRAPTDVDWSAFGDASADQLGAAVALVDATGDGLADVVVGVANDELGAAPNPVNAGALAVYAGVPDALPAPAPVRRAGGPAANDRCGWAAAALPRGAGLPADLVALCVGTDTAGPDVGGPVVHRHADGVEATIALTTPVAPAPWRVGHALARVPDLDGDGFDELAVGAPDEILLGQTGSQTGSHQPFAGVVRLHRGTADGFEAAASARLAGFTGHSGADRLGQGLASGDIDGDGQADLIVVSRLDDRPTTLAAATYTTTDCGTGAITDPGAVYVFSRADDALTPTPTHVFFGTQSGQGLERALAIDVDGDGKDDVVAANQALDAPGRTNAGGFQIHLGRAPTAGRITAACTPALQWLGPAAGDLAGTALAALGDLDHDGCEDFAVGAPLDNLAATDAGAVYLVLGGGPTCAAPAPRAAVLTGLSANDGIGESLDAADVDGDGAPELLVGSSRHRRNNVAVGAVWLVPGTTLEALARDATLLVDGAAPDARAPIVAAADASRLRLQGALSGERFGATAAIVRRLGPGAHAAIVVASPAGDRAGVPNVSTFVVHELRFGTFEPLTIAPTPIAVLAGETSTPAVMGVTSIVAATQGEVGVLALGVADSNAHARDLGAVYVARVDVVEPLLPPVPPRGPPPCDPPLALTPSELWVVPGGAATLAPSGGTAEYTFELAEAPSGGAVDPGTGAYVAGEGTGDDRIVLTAKRCDGSASALVHVVTPVAVTPDALEVAPGGAFVPRPSGGSGEYAFALEPNASGATFELGTYTAGALEGRDTLTVTDVRTGAIATVDVTVSAAAGPHLGAPVVYVPVGHGFTSPPSGGSGEHDATASGDFAWVDGAWQVDGPGAGEVVVTDRWTGASARQAAHALLALEHTLFRSASAAFTPSIAVARLDGDALLDAVVALPEASLERSTSGALWVFRGTVMGLDPEPIQALSGLGQGDQLGRGVALHDVDGDGVVDLIVGVPRVDTTLADVGAVQIHRGAGDGTFDPSPLMTLRGLRASDLFGTQVAVCDLDGDGQDELIVTAPTAEDTAATPSASAQGGLFVYRGGPDGWPTTATLARWGQAPSGTAWVNTANLQMGLALATGDLDGDGACDLVTASQVAMSNAGAVWVHRGVLVTTGPELVSPTPVRAWTGEYAGGTAARLGSGLAVGDLDGDGRDDLVVGQRTWSTVANAANSFGAARLALGGDWLATVEVTWRTSSDFAWSVFGTASGDQLGYAVAVGDATGDARPDVIVGALVDEIAGGAANAGVVTVYPGVVGAVPATTATRTIAGPAVNDRLGTAIASLSRAGAPSTAILAMSQLSDENGPDVGGAHVLTVAQGEARADLVLEVALAPWRIGHALATLPDIDGDGLAELAIGAPDEQFLAPSGPDHRSFAGLVHLHRGADPAAGLGFFPEPFQRLGGFPGHSAADRFGNDVAPIGDFDGDGHADLAVVARFEDRPSSWSTATYAPAADCVAGALSNDGAVYVFSGDGLDAWRATPTFVFYGPQAEQALDRVIGPGDIDGDGLADLVVSSDLLDDTGKSNVGGLQVWTGRAATASRITVGCTPALTWLGRAAGDSAGAALAPLGDLDADGCADFAVGAPLESSNDRGAVYLVLGAGATCASPTFRVTALTGPAANDGVGQALDAADLDGDGRVELAVGSARHRVGGVAQGAVWLVDGRRLAELAALATPVGTPEATAALVLAGDVGRLRLEGLVANERFGLPLVLVPSVGPSGRAAIAVGSGAGARTGHPGVSSIVLFPITTPTAAAPDTLLALDPSPVAILAGETRYPDVLGAGDVAFVLQGEVGLLALGLEESNVHARDVGGVYVAPLGPVDDVLSEPAP